MSHAVVEETQELLERVRRAHRTIYERLSELKARAHTPTFSQSDRVDLGYMCREMRNLFDDLRKESDHVREKLDQIICVVWVKDCEENPHEQPSIRGSMALGIPDVKMSATLPTPKTDPEGFGALMEYVGVEDLELIQSGALKLHWPGWTVYLSSLAEKGLPLPPGIQPDNVHPVYRVTYRKRTDTPDPV